MPTGVDVQLTDGFGRHLQAHGDGVKAEQQFETHAGIVTGMNLAAAQFTSRPAWMRMRWAQRAAMFSSWVTSTRVVPISRLSSNIRSMTA